MVWSPPVYHGVLLMMNNRPVLQCCSHAIRVRVTQRHSVSFAELSANLLPSSGLGDEAKRSYDRLASSPSPEEGNKFAESSAKETECRCVTLTLIA
ncbi:unnamed protein product, partial [Nesidiocoris tenuis]